MREGAPLRLRDPEAERQERRRYQVLEWIYEITGEDCDAVVHASQLGEALGISREEAFRIVEHLAYHGYLRYVGAGPQVCITEKGLRYLQTNAWRRRSVRDEPSPPPSFFQRLR